MAGRCISTTAIPLLATPTVQGLGGVWWTVPYVQVFTPLFDNTTVLEPALQEDTPTALITRLADRARDRHAREAQFQIYDHYLSFYWEHRTAEIEIVDTIGKGGNTITFNVTTEWPLSPTEAELRFFHLNAAVYANNGIMTAVPGLDVPGETRRHYTRSVNFNPLTGQPLQVGDRMEFELSQFLTGNTQRPRQLLRHCHPLCCGSGRGSLGGAGSRLKIRSPCRWPASLAATRP